MDVDLTASETLNVLHEVVAAAPVPKAATQLAGRCTEAIGQHLIFLIPSCELVDSINL
jgi:hypothetical protein